MAVLFIHLIQYINFPIVLADLGPLQTRITTLVTDVQNILSGIGITVGVIGIVVGGLMRATAFGNERKVAMSNQAIACAVIGLMVVAVAQTAATAFTALAK